MKSFISVISEIFVSLEIPFTGKILATKTQFIIRSFNKENICVCMTGMCMLNFLPS